MALAIARKVLQTEAAAILALVDRLDERFDRAIRLLLACRGRVIVTGMGKSGIICRKIAATLASTGTPAHFLHPAEAIHGDLGVIQAEDVVIALSNSGETEELVRLLETIKRLGAKLITISGNDASTLAQASDVALDCHVSEEACPMNLVPTASTTAALALGDALAMTLLVAKGFREEDFVSLHPRGALGKRLMRAGQLMHAGDGAPTVTTTTPIKDVVREMSRKGMGMTCVVDERSARGHHHGRRSPPSHESVGRTSSTWIASDIMTRNPVTIGRGNARHGGAQHPRAAQDHLDCRRRPGPARRRCRAPARPLANGDVLDVRGCDGARVRGCGGATVRECRHATAQRVTLALRTSHLARHLAPRTVAPRTVAPSHSTSYDHPVVSPRRPSRAAHRAGGGQGLGAVQVPGRPLDRPSAAARYASLHARPQLPRRQPGGPGDRRVDPRRAARTPTPSRSR